MTLGMVHEWVHAGSATFTLRLVCGISAVWLAAALAAIVLRRSSAALRHRVWSLSIAAALVLPALVAVMPEWRVGAISLPPAPESPAARVAQASATIVPSTPVLPERTAGQAMGIDLPPIEMPHIVPESPSAPPAAHPISPSAAEALSVPWSLWFWLAWLIPALGLILWQAAALLAAHNLVRRSAPLHDGPGAERLSRLVSRLRIVRPRLLEGAEIGSPICLGCWRPAILLPVDWKDWLPAQLEAVLTHELAHVTRRDVLWQLLARLACALYWLHPLAWVAVWRLRVERELACDDWVLRGGESSTRYARWLLEAATRLLGREPHAAERIGVAMAARSGFEKRIRAILDPNRRRFPVSRPMAVILTLAAAAILGLAGMLSPLAAENADAGETRSATAENTAIASELVRFSGRVEDEAGRALAGAVVEVSAWPAPPRSVRTTADGRFALETRRGRSGKHRLHARTSDGTQQGMQLVEFAELGNVDDLRLMLRPARELAVTVKDDKGQPIAGAWVAAVAHTWPYATTSDAMGRALLRMPADAELESVLADKPDVGLDYALFRRKGDLRSDPYRLDPTHRDPIDLTLNGATTVRVRVVDGEQCPLEGVRVLPWLFTKPMKGGDLNVSALQALQRITDARGMVEFRNIPADNTRPVIFWPRLDGYCVPKRGVWDPKSGQAEVTVQMLRQLQVRGHVVDTDRRPVGGAKVLVGGQSQGDSSNAFHANAVSAEDGSFHLAIDPNMRYLFVASYNRLASMAHVQMIGAEAPADPIKLVVQPATQVHGSIVVGPDRAPSPGASILLVQRDDWAPQESTLPGGAIVRGGRPSVFHHIKADEQGRFDAWIAPGEYQISCDAGMGVSRQIELGDDGTCTIARYDDSTRTEEIVQVLAEGIFLTLHAEARPALPPLKGRVVLTDKPAVGVADVALVGIVKDGGSVRMEGASDQQGSFTLARDPSDVYLHAATADGKLRGMVWVPADAGETVVPIGPTASVSGRVLDEKGEVLAGRAIRFGLRMDDRSTQYPRAFGEGVSTGADGSFTIDGLVPGFDYRVTISVLADRRAPRPIVANVTPRRAERIELGDVKLAGTRD